MATTDGEMQTWVCREAPRRGNVDPLPSSSSGKVLIRHQLGSDLHVVKEAPVEDRLGLAGLLVSSKHDVGAPWLVWGHGLGGHGYADPLHRAVLCTFVPYVLFQLQTSTWMRQLPQHETSSVCSAMKKPCPAGAAWHCSM